MSAGTMKNSMKFLRNFKVDLSYYLAVLLLGIYLRKKEKKEKLNLKVYVLSCLLQNYLQKPRYGSNLKVSMDEWMKKEIFI